jgi:hypothetical protein
VIGLTTDDPRLAAALVARCVRLVVPVVSMRFSLKLAAAVGRAEAVLEDLHTSEPRQRSVGYEREAPLALVGAIRAITDFRVPDGDVVLRQVLTEAIAETRHWLPQNTPHRQSEGEAHAGDGLPRSVPDPGRGEGAAADRASG